jgi:hypothetical protein
MSQNKPDPEAIPNTVPLSPEKRKIVLAGTKFLIARLKKAGKMDDSLKYKDIIRDDKELYNFIRLVKENLDIGKDLFVDGAGKPVTDLETPLVCGASLSQLERMLVLTHASLVFVNPEDGVKKPTTAKKRGIFAIFGGKSDTGDKRATTDDHEGQRKLDEFRPYLAFAWQLPLVSGYNEHMVRAHARVLEFDLFSLDTPAKVELIGKINPTDIRNVQNLAGEKFEEIIANDPGSVKGMSLIKSKAKLELMRKVAESRSMDLFTRGPDIIHEIMSMDENRVWALGPSVADITFPALDILKQLKIPTLKLFMEVFRETYGDNAPRLLREDQFVQKFLRQVVSDFVQLEAEDDLDDSRKAALGDIIAMKWRGLDTRINDWLRSRDENAANAA